MRLLDRVLLLEYERKVPCYRMKHCGYRRSIALTIYTTCCKMPCTFHTILYHNNGLVVVKETQSVGVLMAATFKSTVFWLSVLVISKRARGFGGSRYIFMLFFPCLADVLILEMEAPCSSESSVSFRIQGHYAPETVIIDTVCFL
jgi:hypothetical protein